MPAVAVAVLADEEEAAADEEVSQDPTNSESIAKLLYRYNPIGNKSKNWNCPSWSRA